MPRATDPAARLASRQRRYHELAGRLAEIGLVAPGSIVRRYTRCGKPNCRCQADPPQLHGPYWQWSASVSGKTVTRRLTEQQATLYRQWIANDRQLRQLINQLRRAADESIQLILQTTEPPGALTPESGRRG
jgi:hypothetical protein